MDGVLSAVSGRELVSLDDSARDRLQQAVLHSALVWGGPPTASGSQQTSLAMN